MRPSRSSRRSLQDAAITRTAAPRSFAGQGASVVAFAMTLFETDRRAGSTHRAGRSASTGWQCAAEATSFRAPANAREARSLNRPQRHADSCTVRPYRPRRRPQRFADRLLSRRRFYGENKKGRHAAAFDREILPPTLDKLVTSDPDRAARVLDALVPEGAHVVPQDDIPELGPGGQIDVSIRELEALAGDRAASLAR
jgi:hypothetical protein